MKIEDANKIVDTQFEKLVSTLEQGQSETLKAHLAAIARFYRYSFRNLMLIFSQRPDATRVAGFNTWKKLHRWVKKGEKGITIISPMKLPNKETSVTSEIEEVPIAFRASHVFDVAQTEGEPIPQLGSAEGDPGKYLEQLRAFIINQGIVLHYSTDLDTAEGRSKGGTIEIRVGLEAAAEFSVLVHELAHEMMHHSPEVPKQGKKVLETEAESVAFIVTEAIGLSTNNASTDYIQLYNGNADTLRKSLEAVQKTASKIISALIAE
jgi:antirestriction protein ArdC